MFLEYWMILVLAILSGLWGEYRYKNGNDEGIIEAVKDVEERIIRSRLQGSYATVVNLMNRGILKIDDNGAFIGYNGTSWNPLTDVISNENAVKIEDL